MQREVVVAIVILLFAIVVYAIWRMRRRAPAPTVRAVEASHEAAMLAPSKPLTTPSTTPAAAKSALAALDALDLPPGRERGLQLATIARRFLSDAHGIPAMSATTAELHEQLRRHDLDDEAWRGVVDSIDAVRFGGPAAIRDLEKYLREILSR